MSTQLTTLVTGASSGIGLGFAPTASNSAA
jgi:short-subunit dehydrogenase